jgi:segregation and condensation protein B
MHGDHGEGHGVWEQEPGFGRVAAAVADRQLYLVESPADRIARILEGLLVVSPRPLPVEELAQLAGEPQDRIEIALALVAGRHREGRSGIVLERVAGGYAFRAAREAAEACGRLFEKPVQRGLSQAALETLAVVAYLGPVSRPEITRIRGVVSDSSVAGLAERGLIEEAGRGGDGGAVLYRTTALFERVFGLANLDELPALDDLAGDAGELRERLEAVAARRA